MGFWFKQCIRLYIVVGGLILPQENPLGERVIIYTAVECEPLSESVSAEQRLTRFGGNRGRRWRTLL